MQILGHRGSRRPGPENTVAAVTAALAAGADGCEIDVRLAAGALVVRHDPPSAHGQAAAVALAAVLDAGRGRRMVCEVKNRPGDPDFDAPRSAAAHALVDLVGGRSGDDLVVSSFDWFSLDAVRERGGPPTAFLTPFGMGMRAGVAHARERGHAEVHPHWSAVSRRGLDAAHGAGLAVVAWTVTSVLAARRLQRLGVDGVICDDPAAVVAGLRGLVR